MSRVSVVLLAVIGVAVAIGSECTSVTLGAEGPSPFAVFVDDYFNAAFEASPSRGTAAGLHQYDNRLEDGSAEAVEKRVGSLKAQQARLDKLRAGTLTAGDAIDAEVLDGAIKSELLELDEKLGVVVGTDLAEVEMSQGAQGLRVNFVAVQRAVKSEKILVNDRSRVDQQIHAYSPEPHNLRPEWVRTPIRGPTPRSCAAAGRPGRWWTSRGYR